MRRPAKGVSEPEPPPEPSKPALPEGQYRIKKGPWVACKTKDTLGEVTGYMVDQDWEAFRRALARYVLSGECIRFEGGEIVHLADVALFSGLIKVRKRGDTAAYWTNSEAREVD